ncbi:MAG: CYTH domain-containing protein [Bacilli bacterium]
MSRNIEYEERVLLTKEQYDAILTFYTREYPHHHFIEQTNFYFDTKEHELKKQGIVFRLRTILNHHTELTLKFKKERGDAEINQFLTYSQELNMLSTIQIPDGEIKEALTHISIPFNLYTRIGSMKTKRLEIAKEDYLIVIDENTYFGITDYNLEIEGPSMKKAKEILLQLCNIYHLTYKKDYSSKSSRLFHYLNK